MTKYDQLSTELDELLNYLNAEGLGVGKDVQRCVDVMQEFFQNRKSMDDDQLANHWDSRFDEFCRSYFVVARLTSAVLPLQSCPGLRSVLRDVLRGDLTEQSTQNEAKDKFFELEVGSVFVNSGFEVELAEPDLVVAGNGLSERFGIACKYPSSEKQIHSHLSKGYKQLSGAGLEGCVAIGMDQIIFRGFDSYKDFRKTSKSPQQTMQEELDVRLVTLAKERPEKYPSEEPMESGMMFLRAGGILDDPTSGKASLVVVGVASLATNSSNPTHPNVQLLYDAMKRLA